MSISIVMLTYNNYEKFLRSMTSMFYFITEPRIKEFIFLDNGSHEFELKNFLRQLDSQISKVRVIFSDKNLGIAKGRKILYDVSEGDYIASFDSDIVIVNPPLFLEVFYKTLDLPDMMLIGGGGGDHPFFPSLEKENIDNKDSPETSEELRVVDEVAGWFHGFKTSILTKNGGKVEMDEQFSPFWAEDSDFCMQIKMLGGKCSIMGKGIVAHQWSSCDKKKTQLSLENMWNKFQDKWYTIFGKNFKFDVEDKFYEDNYPNSKSVARRKEFYHKIGMIEGHFYSKNSLKFLFPDVKFINNTKLVFENNQYSINEFDKQIFTYDRIVKKHFKIIESSLPKNIENLIIITSFNTQRCLEIIKNIISIQRCYIAVILPTGEFKGDIISTFRKYNCPYMVAEFPNFHFDLIPYIISAKELMKTHNIKNILNLSTERDNSEFLSKTLENFNPGYYLEKQISDLDKFCLSFIDQLVSLNQDMKWNKDCIYYEPTEYLEKLFRSYPIMGALLKCMKIPRDYIISISPRCSPRHSLERMIGYIKPKIKLNLPTYYTVFCTINDEEDLNKVAKNISHMKNGEICIVNKGSLGRISNKQLNYDYYFSIDIDIDIKKAIIISLSNNDLSKYSNFVFCDDSFEIVNPVDEFFERSLYKNLCFSVKNDEFNLSLFSIVLDNIVQLINMIEKEDFNFQEYFKSTNTVFLWNSKVEENDEEIIIEYFKSGIDDGEDFPLI